MARAGPTIADTVLRLLQERGPQALEALVPEIVGAGLTRAKDPQRAVRAAIDGRAELLLDWEGRWCSLVDQLEGAIFTHRMTDLELRDEIVILPAELALLERLALRPRAFAGGGEVHLDWVYDFFELPLIDDWDEPDDVLDPLDDELVDDLAGFVRELGVGYDVGDEQAVFEFLQASRYLRLLHGPPGWLPPLLSGQLLGLGVRGGAIETIAVDRRAIRGPHVGIVGAQVARLARLVIGPDASWFGPPTIEMEELLGLVATEAPQLLQRPLPPFAEVVERGGLEVVDGLVGHRGTDWDAVRAAWLPTPQDAWGFRPSRKLN
jgi:hypothetical protein